jgi:FtsH-binding integral membrane protein
MLESPFGLADIRGVAGGQWGGPDFGLYGAAAMADWNDRSVRVGSGAQTIDAGLRAYMLGVYNYMALGVALTGLVAFVVVQFAATSDPTGIQIGRELYLTAFGQAIYLSPLKWLVIFAPLVFVLILSARVRAMSAPAVQLSFWAFSAIMGLSLSSILLVYAGGSVARVFFISAATFGALSLWGYTTKRDLTGMGSFMIMGLFGVILASVVNLFWPAPALSFAISIIGVIVFAGLTAYDTQRIKEMYVGGMDRTATVKTSVMGALSLYLDFINLFLMLLRLMGQGRN